MTSSILILMLLALPEALSAQNKDCNTAECLALGANLVQNINLSVDPCQNFYEFACGGFSQRFRYDIDDVSCKPYTDASAHMVMEVENRMFQMMIDASQVAPEDPRVQVAAQLARSAFNNCLSWGDLKFPDLQSPGAEAALNTAASRNLESLLEHLLVDAQPPRSLEQLLARTSSMGFHTVFGLSAPEDLINYLSAGPSAKLPMNATKLSVNVNLFNYTMDASLWLPMFNFLASSNGSLSGSLFRGMASNAKLRIAAIAEDVKAIVESLQHSNVSFQGSMNELNQELSSNSTRPFNWSLFIRELLPGPVSVDGATVVQVDNFPLLKALLDYFKANPSRTKTCRPGGLCRQRFQERHVFLILDAMLELVDLLPLPPRDTRQAKDSPLASLIVTKPRNQRRQCLEMTDRLLEPITEWLYRRHFFPGNFQEIERVINETKNAMIAGMQEQSWITSADKDKMIDKVLAMRHFVGHKELSELQVGQFYNSTVAQFDRTRTTDFGYILGLALKAHARRHLDVIASDTAPSPFLWESPFTVNAFNDMESNTLLFPLGILSPPVYSSTYPDFALYGGFASLVGHEIGHGFADQWCGRPGQSEAGQLQLEPETELGYLRLVQCVRDDFADQNSSLADDIADIVGISAAFRAFYASRSRAGSAANRNWRPTCLGDLPAFSDINGTMAEQRLFFVQSAQVFCTKASPDALSEMFKRDAAGSEGSSHSPGPARVNGMARNSPEFARAFECPLGSPMNPAEKCVFW